MMTTIATDKELTYAILREINDQSIRGVVPVHDGHLKHMVPDDAVILDYLLAMKDERSISGDLVTRGSENKPYRLTNIRLTYAGLKAIRPA